MELDTLFDFLDDIPSEPTPKITPSEIPSQIPTQTSLSPKTPINPDGSVGQIELSLRQEAQLSLEEHFPELLSYQEATREFVEIQMILTLRTSQFEVLSRLIEEVGGANLTRWEDEVMQAAQLSTFS